MMPSYIYTCICKFIQVTVYQTVYTFLTKYDKDMSQYMGHDIDILPKHDIHTHYYTDIVTTHNTFYMIYLSLCLSKF